MDTSVGSSWNRIQIRFCVNLTLLVSVTIYINVRPAVTQVGLHKLHNSVWWDGAVPRCSCPGPHAWGAN